MDKIAVKGITPFLPAKDHLLSQEFYFDLGFRKAAEIDKACLYEIGDYGFWLQDYYVQGWAENSMLCMYVDEIGGIWSKARAIDYAGKYKDLAKLLSEPHEQEGALMFQLCDPSGILWHIRESK